MQLTRGQMKSKAIARVPGADNLTPGADDPIINDDDLDEVFEDIQRVGDSSYITKQTGLVSGQKVYCFPGVLYFLDEAEIENDQGKRYSIELVNIRTANGRFPNWRREETSTGNPTVAIVEGIDRIVLYPTPNYSVAGDGFTIRGYGIYTRSDWPLESSVCPIGEIYHQTIVHGLAERVAYRIGNDRARQEEHRLWFRGKGSYESELGTLTEDHKHRRVIWDSRVPSGPLNM